MRERLVAAAGVLAAEAAVLVAVGAASAGVRRTTLAATALVAAASDIPVPAVAIIPLADRSRPAGSILTEVHSIQRDRVSMARPLSIPKAHRRTVPLDSTRKDRSIRVLPARRLRVRV